MKLNLVLLLIGVIPLLLISCVSEERPQPQSEAEVTAYEVKGRYLATNPEGPYISVVHEEIPEVMNAMRMNLLIDDISISDNLERGDIISFKMVREGMSWYARDITPLPDETEINLPEHLQRMGLD